MKCAIGAGIVPVAMGRDGQTCFLLAKEHFVAVEGVGKIGPASRAGESTTRPVITAIPARVEEESLDSVYDIKAQELLDGAYACRFTLNVSQQRDVHEKVADKKCTTSRTRWRCRLTVASPSASVRAGPRSSKQSNSSRAFRAAVVPATGRVEAVTEFAVVGASTCTISFGARDDDVAVFCAPFTEAQAACIDAHRLLTEIATACASPSTTLVHSPSGSLLGISR